MATQQFDQQVGKDAAGVKTVSIGQTREGKDEWITPVSLWERNKNTGLYLPPGVMAKADVAKPRVEVANDDAIPVQLSGTIMEIYGATIANRPNANSVPIGATYMAVNSQEVWQSNGADWVVM